MLTSTINPPATKEGLDTQMSLLYYSRIRFILNLTPLLYRSQSPSGAHVISIFAGTMEDRIDAKNLRIFSRPWPRNTLAKYLLFIFTLG
jgi:hypothetical protein